MEHKIACKIGHKLVERNIVESIYEEVYIYGLELIISFISTVLWIALIGGIANQIISAVIFIIIFVLLRRFTGGYHADTHFKCKLCTLSIYVAVILLSNLIYANLFAYIILACIGAIIIIRFAPIENPNKAIPVNKRKRLKILSFIMFTFILTVGLFIMHTSRSLSNYIFYSLLSVIALIIPNHKKGRKSK